MCIPTTILVGCAIVNHQKKEVVVWIIFAAVSSLIMWMLPFRRLMRLRKFVHASESLIESELDRVAVESADEIDRLFKIINYLNDSRNRTRQNAANNLTGILVAMKRINQGQPCGTLNLELKGELSAAFNGLFQELEKSYQIARYKSAVYMAFFQSQPSPILVAERSLVIRYVNPAMEKMLGMTASKIQGRSLLSLIVDVPSLPANGDPTIQFLESNRINDWIRTKPKDPIYLAMLGDQSRTVPVKLRFIEISIGKETVWSFQASETSSAWNQESIDRAAIRENLSRQLLDRVLEEIEPVVNLGTKQIRILTGEAKQSSQKNVLIPRIQSVNRLLLQLESFRRQILWFQLIHRGELPNPAVMEFSLPEVLLRLRTNLNQRLEFSEVALEIEESTGWFCGDEEWLEAILEGALMHAIEASTSRTLSVQVARLPSDQHSATPRVQFTIPEAGLALLDEEIEVIEAPFGGWGAPPLMRFSQGGFPLGLITASRLASRLGGVVDLSMRDGGRQAIRIILPSRFANIVVPSSSVLGEERIPYDETVEGWRIGKDTIGVS